MQRLFSLVLTLVLSTALVLAVSGTATFAKDKVYTIKFGTWYPVEGHLMSGVMKEFINNLEERSNGRIKVQYFPAGQMGGLKELMDVTQKGALDMTGVVPQIVSGKLPLNTFITLPTWQTAVEGSEIYERTFAEVPALAEEFAKYNLVKLGAFTCSQYDVGTTEKQVTKPEDLNGLKLSVTGGFMNNIAMRYGIKSASRGPNSLYEALQKGILDGSSLSHVSTNGYKVYEVEKYLTNGLRMGSVVTIFVMNQKAFRKLPKDLQDIVIAAGEELGRKSAQNWDDATADYLAKFEKAGVNIYTVKPEERAMWDAPLKGIGEEWVGQMEEKGLPGQETYDVFSKISKEVVK